MTNEQIIRKAVELAEGWSFQYSPLGNQHIETLTGYQGTTEDQEILDALAAQLVRQYYKNHQDDPVFYENDVMDVIKYVVDRMH